MPWDKIWKPAIEPFGMNLRSISFGGYARPPPASHQPLGIIYITNNGKTKNRWNRPETAKNAKRNTMNLDKETR